MTKPKQMWRETRLAKEEGCSIGDSSGEEASKVTPPERKLTQNRVTGTQSQEIATQTRVPATRVRRMTGKERSGS
jgi:hypothetical protein